MKKEPLCLGIASLLAVRLLTATAFAAPLGGTPESATGSEALSRPAGTSLTPESTNQPAGLIPQDNAPLVNGMTVTPDGTVSPEIKKDRTWKFFFSASVTGVFTDNFYLSSRNEEKDFSISLSPKLAVGRGDVSERALTTFGFSRRENINRDERGSFIFASYAPSQTFYLNHGRENQFDHDAVIAGLLKHRKLELEIDSRLRTLSTPDEETSTRVERTVFDGRLIASYELTGKLALESSIRSQITEYRFGFSSYRVYSNENFVDYRVTALLRIGLGAGFGYVEPESSSNQTFQQGLVRVALKTTEKLDLLAKFGGETRQVSGGEDSANPVFSLGLTYRFTERTRFTLEGSRLTAVSVTNPQENYVLSFVSGGMRQQLTPHFELGLFAGYSHRDYERNFGEVTSERSEDVVYVRPELGYTLGRFSRCDLSYEFRNKDSSEEDRSFTENVTSLTVEFLF